MFVSQTHARIMPINMQLQTIKKGSMTISAYFTNMKRMADTVTIIGQPIEHACYSCYSYFDWIISWMRKYESR